MHPPHPWRSVFQEALNPTRLTRATWHLLQRIGLFYLCGLLLIALMLFGFADLTTDVLAGELAVLNLNAAHWVRQSPSPIQDHIAMLLNLLGGGWGLALLTGFAALYLTLRKHTADAILLILLMSGGGLLVDLLKNVFQLSRPEFLPPLIPHIGFSFPSGHATAAVSLYEYLSFLLLEANPRSSIRWLGAILFSLFPIGMLWSRMYLGVHWLSDVLAGVLVATCWVTFCLLLRHFYYSTYLHRR